MLDQARRISTEICEVRLMSCDLCDTVGGELLWQDAHCRIVWVDDPDYPGFCRVIWQRHVREMTDLSKDERTHFMSIVFAVEEILRAELQPEKINLASLGNMTPHLHWHVIPRFADDKNFPNPIWGSAVRTPRPSSNQAQLSAALKAALWHTLG